MEYVEIIFDKSLVISKSDFKVFENENYYIDDGSTHVFLEEENSLLVLDTQKEPAFLVNFQSITFENEPYFEISFIKHRLEKPLHPESNLRETQREILNIIKNVFALLDNILLKRTKDNKSAMCVYKYLTYDKNSHLFDVVIGLEKRFSYLQLLPKLKYLFAITD